MSVLGFCQKVFRALLGTGDGATHKELQDALERDQLSRYLPWVSYDPDTEQYLLQDDTVALMWECDPLFFAGSENIKTLEGLFSQGLPDRSILQFVLAAEPNLKPLLNSYAASKRRKTPLLTHMTNSLSNYYTEGQSGLPAIGGMPLRNFRLFVCVKYPVSDAKRINQKEILVNMRELLRGARLNPRPFTPELLLDYMRRLLNDEEGGHNGYWDDAELLGKQCIFGGTDTEVFHDKIVSGNKVFKCLTPHSFPPYVNAFQTNLLFGGVMGLISDSAQIRTPFIYSLNIVLRDMKKMLHTKCNFILGQQAIGSFAPSLMRKKSEYMWAVDEIEKGTKFVRVIPTLWVYGDDDELVTGALARTVQLWKDRGYNMQIDKGILMPLFITSLPGGLYNHGNFVDQLDRDFVAPIDAVTEILPIQGDFSGFGQPILPFVGRKGQLFGIDLWAHNSHNALVCAMTGGGKSVLLNFILNNYYGVGAKIRVVDIGGSYKKMTGLHGAKFLDFAPGNDVNINPFTNVSNNPDEPDDTESDLVAIPGIISEMCYSSGEGSATATDMNLIEHAVRWAFQNYGNSAGTDQVREYLGNFRKYMPNGEGGQEAEARAQMLAFNMAKFCTGGSYGRYFNGPANFDISKDDFVVLELEHLEKHKDLFRVVTLQIINAVTQDLYLGEKTRKKLILFDEAWKFLGESSSIKTVIEEGYRRARKYNGSFTIITQSITDLIQFGPVGRVIRNNSAFKFYLYSSDFDAALNEKLIEYSPFVMDILKSLVQKPSKYSEVFIDSPFGVGVGRLLLDRFNYFTNTTTAHEVEEIDGLIANGMSVEEAINEMVRRYP